MKKAINIALIVVVISIWGTAGFRFLHNYFRAEPSMLQSTTPITSMPVMVRDTFELLPITRDPFLNKATVTEKVIYRPKKVIHKEVPPIKVNIPMPDIQYYGYIKSDNKDLILLKVDGIMLKMHKGEKNRNILVKKIFKDSVGIIYNNIEKVYKRSSLK